MHLYTCAIILGYYYWLFIVDVILTLKVPLLSLTCDQSADGKADAELVLRATNPNFVINFDLWHKVYPMTKHWKSFLNKRIRKRGPFKYPWLKEMNDLGKLFLNHD